MVWRIRDEADLAALLEEHYGAMHRLARLVGGDPGAAREAVRAAWSSALADPEADAEEVSPRGRLLRLVLRELAAPGPPAEAVPAAASHELEPEGNRWAGWWKDDLPATPDADRELLEAAVAALPPGLAAVLVLRDVEGLPPHEVASLVGHSPEHQLAFLHQARTAVRNALRAGAETAA